MPLGRVLIGNPDDTVSALQVQPVDVKIKNGTDGKITLGDCTLMKIPGTGLMIDTSIVSTTNIEASTVGAGFILKSPDGTRHRINVANDGTLSSNAL
jgi:hypothetical protein